MAVYRSLHLSDLHIGGTYLDSQELAYKIANDIASNGTSGIRNVLVTGDIFHGPAGKSGALVEEAADFFRTLLSELNANGSTAALTEKDFLFVPGNHDIVWTEDLNARWEKYRGFLRSFYGDIPDWYDPEDLSFCRPCPEDKLVFLGFNSCGLEKQTARDELIRFCREVDGGKYRASGIDKDRLLELLEAENPEEYADYGEISMRQFSRQRRKMDALDGYQAVAMFHHHFFLFPDNPGRLGDADVVRNHAAVVRSLRSMRVRTVLHGHKHFDLERPFINDDYYETAESIIDVFAGGSVAAQGLQRHTFSVIDFYPEHDAVKLRHQKFAYKDDALEPIRTIQIPPMSKPAQIVRLLELLKSSGHDAYSAFEAYQAAIMANARFYQSCTHIIEWTGSALTGYAEVYRLLDRDRQHLLCLLYAIARRALAYISQHSPDRGASLALVREQLGAFFAQWISPSVPEGYEALFDAQGLDQAARLCAELLDKQTSYLSRQYLAFTMVGVFFADLNLVLTEYADDFYHQISHKVNIKLEPNHFHAHVPAPRIGIQSDADRRSAYVKMWCSDATAHKMAVLFVKEFDLSINKFEDFFKLIGLKLYYLLPQIEKDASLDALDNYNFEAYIPSLLPLLIGENIYRSKEVFARELVQNSIDAISVREALAGPLGQEDRAIRIFLGSGRDGRRIFRITDRGTGMDRYKVERYFTSIGRSFYSGEDYAELGIGYKPISSFGIGFLSSFMVCHEIDVRTRSFDGDREGLKLHIPNYEGCFFIERDEGAETGTEITLYLEEEKIEPGRIINYLKHSMLDIKYEIEINRESRWGNLVLPANGIRRDIIREHPCLFVPFSADGTVGRLDWERDVLSGRFVEEQDYGLLIALDCPTRSRDISVLNAGIATSSRIRPMVLFDKMTSEFLDSQQFYPISSIRREPFYNNYLFNFPSNWIQLEVSREKIVGYSPWMEAQHQEGGAIAYLQRELALALKEQMAELLRKCAEGRQQVSAFCAANLFTFLRCLAPSADDAFNRWLKEAMYTCQIDFTDQGVHLGICRRQGGEESDFAVLENWRKRQQAFDRMDPELKASLDSAKPVRYAPNLSDFLEQSISLCLNELPSRHGEAGQLRLDNQDLHMLAMSALYAADYMQNHDAHHLTEARAGTDAKTVLADRYRTWKDAVKRFLLCSMTAGEVERGEAWLSVSFEDLRGQL